MRRSGRASDGTPMNDELVLLGLGSNLPDAAGTKPRDILEEALEVLDRRGARIVRRSRWYRSAPVPVSDQPWFVNGAAAVGFPGTPEELLALLHAVEAELGRERRVRNEARVVDLDLLAFGDRVAGKDKPDDGARGLVLPHPELHKRAFVLLPLAEVAPDWRHPLLGQHVHEMVADLPSGQAVEVMEE